MAFKKFAVIYLLDVYCLFQPPNLSTMDPNCFLYLLFMETVHSAVLSTYFLFTESKSEFEY